MFKKIILALLLFPFILDAKINIVTSTPELAWLSKMIGNEHVEVHSLLSGQEDPHFVDALPSYVAKVSRADIFCIVGLDLEVAWVSKVITMSGNKKVMKNESGYCEVGSNIKALEIPQGKIDRSMGDVHAAGNPHFHLSPKHMIQAAEVILNSLLATDSKNAEFYLKKFESVKIQLGNLEDELIKQAQKYLVSKNYYQYHKDFSYLFHFLGLQSKGTIEVVPGVPPSAGQLAKSSLQAKRETVHLALATPLAPQDVLKRFSEISGIKISILPGMMKRDEDYIGFLKNIVEQIIRELP